VAAHFRLAAHLGVLAALALALSGWHGGGWSAAAQSTPKRSAKADGGKADVAKAVEAAVAAGQQRIVIIVNDEEITARDIDQRARFLGLSSNIGEQAKEHFDRLVKSESTRAALEKLKHDVVSSNPGKTQAELVAIFQESQKQLGMSLQKKAIESARAGFLPKWRNQAADELIEERLKLQAAKKLGGVRPAPQGNWRGHQHDG
jgi:peptidyl-prolyl cis-trans isomerase SurA